MQRTAALRITWTVVTLLGAMVAICAVAAGPAVLLWVLVLRIEDPFFRLTAIAAAAAPSYLLFALALMPVSAVATRLLGWRSPDHAVLRIAACEWPLLDWARALAVAHVVRVLSGTLFRGSPVWTWYLRTNGARLGRRVYVNSLAVSDHNLLEFGDDVVVGDGAHISGHTVEHGVVRTAGVRIGAGATIGLCAIVDIGVTIGEQAQLGALSFAPKYAVLEPDAVYVGVPARPLERVQQRPLSRRGSDSPISSAPSLDAINNEASRNSLPE